MPVVPAPRGARTWLRGVLVVVTDAEWAILEPLLAAPGSTAGRGGRPEKHCRRVIVDAILYPTWAKLVHMAVVDSGEGFAEVVG
jgi:hypothetical protein